MSFGHIAMKPHNSCANVLSMPRSHFLTHSFIFFFLYCFAENFHKRPISQKPKKNVSPRSKRGRGRSRNVIIVRLPAGALEQYCSLLRWLFLCLFRGSSVRDRRRVHEQSVSLHSEPDSSPSQSYPRHRFSARVKCVCVCVCVCVCLESKSRCLIFIAGKHSQLR